MLKYHITKVNMSSMLYIWLNIVVYLCILGSHVSHAQQEKPYVQALYIFGDSTADVGTNHYLLESRARADFPFNGIDFPHYKPTGRFSNGYNTIDFIAQNLGFKQSPPPFLSFKDSNISQFIIKSVPSKGINFASGGSGIVYFTGQKKWGKVISLGKQVKQFSSVRNKISRLLGQSALANISKSLFIISVGSNDIFEHYDANRTGITYISTLISTYETHLRKLYELGARKFAVISVGEIGCCPIQRKSNKHHECKEAMNVDAQLFYSSLRVVLEKLSLECKGFVYALADAYGFSKLVVDPKKPDLPVFKESKIACCGKGTLSADDPCREDIDARVCKDRISYLFWDQFHLTEQAAYFAAFGFSYGSPPMVVPMSFVDLAQLS